MVDLHCMVPCPSDFQNTLENALYHCRVLVKSMKQSQKHEVNADKIQELFMLVTTLKEHSTHHNNPFNGKVTDNKILPKRFDALCPRPMIPKGEGWGSNHAQPTANASQPSIWTGFYNKTLRERYNVLSLMYPRLDSAPDGTVMGDSANIKLGELPVRTADLMIENCIGVLGIPLGLGLNFVIDGQHLSVPMAVEEPSVVAAASSAAKLVATMGGGFRTATTGNIMTSQVQLVDTPDISFAIANIAKHRDRLLHMANTMYCANMYKRGGGAVDIYCRVVKQSTRAKYAHSSDHWYTPCDDELVIQASSHDVEYIVVHIDVDVCEAMGANIVNTVAEHLSNEICILTNSRCGLRILTNLCMQRRARSTFEIPIKKLGWKGMEGEQVALRILEAYNFAAIDPYRAVTNNKGIMNGIDAVAVATGQDWRAIEASAHCYASRTGQYATLSKYEIIEQVDGTRVLRGSLELPIAVGSKGGALQTHPGYKAMHAILHHPTAKALSAIIVSVGLAQNFAAIRAIAVTGIQKGHMALHARNIAVAAGAPSELVAEVCSYMLGREAINVETAQEYLQAHQVFSEIHNNSPPSSPHPVTLPSILYVEIPVPRLETKVSVNIAFESINKHPQYISIMRKEQDSEPELSLIQQQLLGDKGYNQLEKMFMFLASMRSIVTRQVDDTSITRANLALQNKLQLLTILINILAHRLMELRPVVVGRFLRQLLASSGTTHVLSHVDAHLYRTLLVDIPPSDDVLSTGLPLLLALSQVLLYHLEQDVAHVLLRQRIASEQWQLLRSIVDSFEMIQHRIERTPDVDGEKQWEQFMSIHAKRWQATMLLLIDSLALSPELITMERIQVLDRIGDYMEWEGTIAHDLARYTRAVNESIPNSYVYWLHLEGMDIGEDGVSTFQQLMTRHRQLKWQRIVHEQAKLSHHIFSLPAVEHVTQIVRDVYKERERSRGRSF